MIKKILVPTDGSEIANSGVEYAVALARQHDARLHGLYVVDVKLLEGPFLRDLSASLGTAPFVNYQNNVAAILDERGKAALKAFADACDAAEVAYETTQATGSVVGTLVEESQLVDLVVMGRRGEHGDWLDGVLGSTTEGVTRRAHCPVLVTSGAEAILERIVIAYDGSVHAKKALQIAAGIGESWGGNFDVVTVADADEGGRVLAEAKSYMEAHSFDVEFSRIEGEPRDAILEFCESKEADLLVIGAYGHTKVRELFLGSTTTYLINHAKCPVLLMR